MNIIEDFDSSLGQILGKDQSLDEINSKQKQNQYDEFVDNYFVTPQILLPNEETSIDEGDSYVIQQQETDNSFKGNADET